MQQELFKCHERFKNGDYEKEKNRGDSKIVISEAGQYGRMI